MLELMKAIENKSYEEICNNEVYYIISIINEISWWGDPYDMPNMQVRKKYYECINKYAQKHDIEISCKELLDPNYKEWLKLCCYLLKRLKKDLLNE